MLENGYRIQLRRNWYPLAKFPMDKQPSVFAMVVF